MSQQPDNLAHSGEFARKFAKFDDRAPARGTSYI